MKWTKGAAEKLSRQSTVIPLIIFLPLFNLFSKTAKTNAPYSYKHMPHCLIDPISWTVIIHI
jgi:hypothetical protein